MKLFADCRHATRLVEQRADGPLPAADTWRLQVHLVLCSYCRRYAKQSRLVAQLALFVAQAPAASEPVPTNEALPAAARARIQARLDKGAQNAR